MWVVVCNAVENGSGGYKKYLREVLPRISRHPAVAQCDLLTLGNGNLGSALDRFNGEILLARSRSRLDGTLAAYCRRAQPDVVFVPTARPIWFDVPVVVMVRNMEPFVGRIARNPVPERIRNAGRRFMAKTACMRSAGVIAVSERLKAVLVRQCRIPAARISVVQHGVLSTRFSPVPSAGPRDRSLILTAGSIRPARGIEDLLQAVNVLRMSHLPMQLSIVGDVDRGMTRYERELRDMQHKLGLVDYVEWAGPKDPAALFNAMRACLVFVMTTRAEACSNIALEAMAAGAPMICTDLPEMRELLGSSALYYSPGDSQQLASLILQLRSSPTQMRRLQRSAEARIRGFTWERTAELTIDALRAAANRANAIRRTTP